MQEEETKRWGEYEGTGLSSVKDTGSGAEQSDTSAENETLVIPQAQ